MFGDVWWCLVTLGRLLLHCPRPIISWGFCSLRSLKSLCINLRLSQWSLLTLTKKFTNISEIDYLNFYKFPSSTTIKVIKILVCCLLGWSRSCASSVYVDLLLPEQRDNVVQCDNVEFSFWTEGLFSFVDPFLAIPILANVPHHKTLNKALLAMPALESLVSLILYVCSFFLFYWFFFSSLLCFFKAFTSAWSS